VLNTEELDTTLQLIVEVFGQVFEFHPTHGKFCPMISKVGLLILHRVVQRDQEELSEDAKVMCSEGPKSFLAILSVPVLNLGKVKRQELGHI
jgi:hypothetical protein